MENDTDHIKELGLRYGLSIALHKLFVDKNLWRLSYLQRMLDLGFYDEMAMYAELGLVVFPDGTYWGAQLTELGRKVVQWRMLHLKEGVLAVDEKENGRGFDGAIVRSYGAQRCSCSSTLKGAEQ